MDLSVSPPANSFCRTVRGCGSSGSFSTCGRFLGPVDGAAGGVVGAMREGDDIEGDAAGIRAGLLLKKLLKAMARFAPWVPAFSWDGN